MALTIRKVREARHQACCCCWERLRLVLWSSSRAAKELAAAAAKQPPRGLHQPRMLMQQLLPCCAPVDRSRLHAAAAAA